MSLERPVATTATAHAPPGVQWLHGSRTRDDGETLVQALLAVQSQLRCVLTFVDGRGEGPLRSAIVDLEELIRVVRWPGSATPARSMPAPTQRSSSAGTFDETRPGHAAVNARCLLEQAKGLRDRLHRTTIALALTEEFVADAFDDIADAGGPHAESHRLWAEQAREGAQTCRQLDARLAALPPPSVVAPSQAATRS